jgi:hypothetical protein
MIKWVEDGLAKLGDEYYLKRFWSSLLLLIDPSAIKFITSPPKMLSYPRVLSAILFS